MGFIDIGTKIKGLLNKGEKLIFFVIFCCFFVEYSSGETIKIDNRDQNPIEHKCFLFSDTKTVIFGQNC